MPAVTLIPLGGTTVNSLYPSPGPGLVEKMPVKDGVRDVGSSPTSSDDQDSAIHKANVKDRPEADKVDTRKVSTPDSPSPVSGYPQALPAHLTPQQPGYYVSYQTQVTPEPPSPAGAAVYDSGSFLQPPAFHNSPFASLPAHQYGTTQQQPPNSPSQNTSGSMGGIPPASPLFPRLTGQATGLLDQHRMFEQRVAPSSPGHPYLSPQIGPAAASASDFSGWTDNRNPQNSYPPNSPQISAQGIPIPYVPGMPPRTTNVAGRSYSFDEMLPPSVESQQQQQTDQQQGQTYTTYGGTQTSGHAGGTLFAHQQPWGYPAGPADMYGLSASPGQPRPTNMAYPGMPGGPPRHHAPHPHMSPPMAPYGGSYFPATSPGPPIQTTASNKGPDGANLFIFHIPNHFTNLDMYQLFCPYGNLLSVRIMVEKDSGRSRGFGFVSYDSPDAAALAIKELNGFAIGNKRLKVQHKQIRSADQEHGDRSGGYDHHSGGNYGGRGHMTSSLPPSGPMAMNSGWYNNRSAPTGGADSTTRVPDLDRKDDANQNPSADDNAGSDALSSMDPLRQTLPEVEGSPGLLK